MDAGSSGVDVDATGRIDLSSFSTSSEAIRFDAISGGIDMDATGNSNITVSGADLLIETLSSGDLRLEADGRLDLGRSGGGGVYIIDIQACTSCASSGRICQNSNVLELCP
jgi:hypothetical protein